MDPVVGAALAGGGISAAGNLIGGLMDNLFAERNARIQYGYQQKLNENQQKWNEKNMAIQNQYQIDQWNRENAYNDPSAVRQRYESAGISAQAAFGQGSASGAGISGSLSSAPSGGMPSSSFSMPRVNSFGGLGDAIAHGAAAASSASRISAENKLFEQQARKVKWENDILNPILADLKKNEAENVLSQTELNKIEAVYRPALLSLETQLRGAKINEVIANTKLFVQKVMESKSVESLNKEQRSYVAQMTKESAERIVRLHVQNTLDTYMAESTISTQAAQRYLMLKQGERYDKLNEVADKEIELMASKIGLNEEQVEELKRRFALDSKDKAFWRRMATIRELRQTVSDFVDRFVITGKDVVDAFAGVIE